MAGLGRKVWGNETLSQPDFQGYVQDQVVARFANAAARTAAISAPTEGMLSTLDDTDSLDRHDGSTWVTVWGRLVPTKLTPATGWAHATDRGLGSYSRLHVLGIGTEVRIRGSVANTSAVTSGTASLIVAAGGIPAGLRPPGTVVRGIVTTFQANAISAGPQRVDVFVDGGVQLTPGISGGADLVWSFDFTYTLLNVT